MKQFDYNKYLKNNPLLKEVDESWNPIKKVKDYLGYKGITIGSARRPTPEEEQIAREYMKSQGKELGSIGVDKYTGNINVMETNGDFRAVLDPDGEELGAWEMQFESSLQEASLQDLLKPLTSKLKSMGYEVDIDPSFGFPIIEAFKTLPDGSILRMSVQPSEAEIQKKMGEPVVGETIDVDFTLWTTKVTKKFFGLYKQKSRDMQRLPDEAGINIDLGTGMFDIPVEQSVERVISLLKKAEAKVSGGTPTRQFTGDANADFMGEAKSNAITTIEPITATLSSDSTKKITIPKGSKVKVLIKRMPKEPKVTQLDYNGQKVNVNAEPFITQYLSEELNENEPAGNIESGIKRIINSKPNPRKSNDTSFLDDVTNSQFIAALRNLRITYKKSRDTYGTDFHLGEDGNDWTFSNEGGTWHAIPSQERLNHN